MTRAVVNTHIIQLSPEQRPERSLVGDAFRRLMRNPLAIIGIVIILLFSVGAIFAPQVAPYSPDDSDLNLYVTPPTMAHLLGTDDIGRDIFSRLIYGASISLSLAGLSRVIGLSVCILAGVLAGLYCRSMFT